MLQIRRLDQTQHMLIPLSASGPAPGSLTCPGGFRVRVPPPGPPSLHLAAEQICHSFDALARALHAQLSTFEP